MNRSRHIFLAKSQSLTLFLFVTSDCLVLISFVLTLITMLSKLVSVLGASNLTLYVSLTHASNLRLASMSGALAPG